MDDKNIHLEKMQYVFVDAANKNYQTLTYFFKRLLCAQNRIKLECWVRCFVDPEATESSSGGDSADEHEKFNPAAVLYAPIKDRAKYRYLKKVGEGR